MAGPYFLHLLPSPAVLETSVAHALVVDGVDNGSAAEACHHDCERMMRCSTSQTARGRKNVIDVKPTLMRRWYNDLTFPLTPM